MHHNQEGAEHESARARGRATTRRGPASPATDRLAGLVGYLLRRAQLRVYAELADSLSPLALRPATFSVLVVIGESPGLSQTAVGETLGIRRANFVAVASELERRRLIERRSSALDRRQNALYLTADGRRLLKRGWRVVLDQEKRIARRLGEADRRRLRGLLELLGADTPRPAAARARKSTAAARQRTSIGSPT